MEAQLLHIQSEDHKIWRLAGCIPLAPAHNISSDAKCLYEKTYMPGVLDLLSRTLADGGPCVGWRFQSVGSKYTLESGTWEAVAVVIREKGAEKKVSDVKEVVENSDSSGETAGKGWEDVMW